MLVTPIIDFVRSSVKKCLTPEGVVAAHPHIVQVRVLVIVAHALVVWD